MHQSIQLAKIFKWQHLAGFSLALLIASGLTLNQSVSTDSADKLASLTKIKSAKQDQPGAAANWWASQLKTSSGKSAGQLNYQYQQQIKEEAARRRGVPMVTKFRFEELGPGVFGGRVRALVVNSVDKDIIVVGGVSGGVWKTINGGSTWQAMSDFLPSLAITTMVVDPDNNQRIFMGTGEGFFNGDAMRGAGMFVSDDFGVTWTQLPSTITSDFHYVNRIAMIPGSDTIIAATRTGLFRSIDLGANWVEVSGQTTVSRGFVDLKLDPSDANVLFASHFGNANQIPVFATVNTPLSIAGDYTAPPAIFGGSLAMGDVTANLILADDGAAPTSDGCEAFTNSLVGAIAVIDRGSCAFTDKVANAQSAGAIGAIVVNNVAGAPINMPGTDATITIPSVMVSMADGDLIKAELPGVNVTLRQDGVTILVDRYILRSIDGGINWTKLGTADGVPDTDVERIELGIGTDGVVYAAISDEASATRGLYRSPGGTANFVKTASNASFIERQGWYDLVVGVNPDDSDIVFMGAVDQYKSTDAGATMAINTFWSPGPGQLPNYVHADQHIYVFDPDDGDIHWAGSDGGIQKTTNNGVTFESINNNLNISQSYGIAVSPGEQFVTSGTQDNGSQMYFGDPGIWLQWFGGDGGYSAWDQQDGNFVYGSTPNGALFGSNDGGSSAASIALPDTIGAAFIQPFTLDVNDGNRMIIGTDNVFFSSDVRQIDTSTWVDVSGSIGTVSATTISSVNGSVAFAGTAAGTLIRIDGLGAANTVTDITGSLFEGTITDIYVEPSDLSGDTLYVTQSTYASDRIHRSTDGGANWTSISGDLPDIPLFSITSDPTDSDTLYVGSELGLWIVKLPSNNWLHYSYGASWTRIIDLIWGGDDTLYIGTHGRGTYKAQRDPIDIDISNVTITNMACDMDGFLDQGESALIDIQVSNNSGIDFVSTVLTILPPSGMQLSGSPAMIGNLAGGSSMTLQFSVDMDFSFQCGTETFLEAMLISATGSSFQSLPLVVSANPVAFNGSFNDGAETVTPFISSSANIGTGLWVADSAQANNGSMSWFAAEDGFYSDKSLISTWFTAESGGNILSFSLFYNLEGDATQFWDGTVLELRTEGGEWQDIGQLSTVPYDGVLFDNNTAPGRLAWSGDQQTWRDAQVDLGTGFTGQRIQFRFRMISDTNAVAAGAPGIWIDDLSFSNVTWFDMPECDICNGGGSTIFLDGFE